MSKINKIKSVVIMLLASVLMFTASAFVMNAKPQAVSAEGEKVFVMSDEVQARMSSPAGLRFRTYLSEEVKAEAEAAEEFGMIIAPAVNFDNAESADYLADGALLDKVIVALDASKLTLDAESGNYFINAVLYNIQEKNWYLDFAAVAYYKSGDVATYANNDVLPRANIGEIVEKEFFAEDGNSETRAQLLENFNYGGMEEKKVPASEIGGVSIDAYTIPAHAIPVNNDNVVAVLTNPDNAYSFKLTEDVVVNNQNISTGDNIISGWDMTLTPTFDGVLDGQGHNLVMSAHTNNRPTRGMLFTTLNGTLKNINVIARADTWTSGNPEKGSFIYAVNGTIENSIITVYPTRYNHQWTLSWAMIDNLGENAVIKNSVFNNMKDMSEKFVRTSNETAIINNVAIVNDKAWAEGDINSIQLVGDIDGLYLCNSATNFVGGRLVYKYDGSAIVATTDLLSARSILGYEVALQNVKVRGGTGGQVDGVFYDNEETLNVPAFASNMSEEELYTVVTNGQEFYNAIKANKNIKLANDITVNGKNSSEADKIAGFNEMIGGIDSLYSGIIDGNGYAITVNTGSANRPTRGLLIDNFTGVIKNVNLIARTDNYGAGKEYPSLIRNMFGSIENSTITLKPTRFGNTWNLVWSVFDATGEGSVIKNTVIYDLGDVTNKFVRTQGEGTIVENVAIVNKATWTTAEIATVSTVGDVSGLYLFNSLNDLVAGAPAYAFDGSAISATSEKINVKETFGYEVVIADTTVIYIPYNGGAYGADVVETIATVITKVDSQTEGVQAQVLSEKISLETNVCADIPVVVTKNGKEFNSKFLTWSFSKDGVVSVVDGKFIAGSINNYETVTATLTCYGIVLASIEIDVAPDWQIVTTGEQFVAAVQANKAVKLCADIAVNNKSVEIDGMADIKNYVANTYGGIIDGQGYTITLTFAEAGGTGVNDGFLFNTLTGTIKNTTFILSTYYYGRTYVAYTGLIGTLDGTFEDSIVLVASGRFGGYDYNYHWSTFSVTTANAVVRNVVIYDILNDMTYRLAYSADANTVFDGVMIVTNSAMSDAQVANVSTSNNMSNTYLFAGVANFANGIPSHEFADGAFAKVSGVTINVNKVLGYGVVAGDMTYYKQAGKTESATGYGQTATVVSAPVFIDSEAGKGSFTVVSDAATLYSTITANSSAKIKLGADIVLNNTNIQADALAFNATAFATFNGILDGQGHTLTINVNTTTRPNGVLFNTLNGTVRNINIIARAHTWASNDYESKGTVFGTVNGTIENCVINAVHTLFGQVTRYSTSHITTVSASALIKDTVFVGDTTIKIPFSHKIEEGAMIENIAIVYSEAWTSTLISNLSNKLVCEVNGLYLFESLDAAVAGSVAYEFANGSIIASTQIVNLDVVKATAIVRAGDYANSVYTDSEQVIDILDFAK